ncbi:MAG: hypothetical protein R6X33_17640 [Candidatus Brocadiia bacterium]
MDGDKLTALPAHRPVLALVILAVMATSASAVEVREARWGFDGTVVPGRINMLSVLVTNDGAEMWQAPVTLEKRNALGEKLGADLMQPCFLAPGMSRWLRFYPYVGTSGNEWRLKVGRDERDLRRPRFGPPATVFLWDASRGGASPRIPVLPEELFPAGVGATDGLHALAIDAVPRWEPVRRRAVMDWLHAGGIVHILHDETGAYPQFPQDMSELNDGRQKYRVGAGRVFRHPIGRNRLTTSYLSNQGYGGPALQESEEGYHWPLEDSVFVGLRSLIEPQHNWALIALALVGYVVLVGPINRLVGGARGDYRRTIGFFLGMVVLFGLLLGYLGRRGYEEEAGVHTLTYARPVGSGGYHLTQWSTVFVTEGDYYTITHPGDQNYYSTCQEFEAVNGVIQNGAGGRFVVDMPLYSSRSFLHRGRAEGPDLGLEVHDWTSESGRTRVSLRPGPGFPEDVETMWAYIDDRFFKANRRGGAIEVDASWGVSRETFLEPNQLRMGEMGFRSGRAVPMMKKGLSASEVYGRFVRPVIAHSLGGTDAFPYYVTGARPDNEALQLYVYATAPREFAVQSEGLGREEGYVLYHVTMTKPEGADDGAS